MIIDFRDDKSVPGHFIFLSATTKNALVEHLNKQGTSKNDVKELYFSGGSTSLQNKIVWATGIAKHFNATVHFAHSNTPVTVYPDIQTAALADYDRRRAAGESIIKVNG